MNEAPNPRTLTGFTAKAAAEIEQNAFAAKTGGLVNLSAPTFWELYEAAKAWHVHAGKSIKKRPCAWCLGTGKNIMHGTVCAECQGTGRAAVRNESLPVTAT